MRPSIEVGDVVVAKPWTEEQRIRVGRVFVFDDPATARGHLMVHRIVELRDDGDYTTAGDANDVTDVTPLPRSDVRATAVLLAPYVGLPVAWARSGDWLRLGVWLLLTMAAFALAVRTLEGEPPRRGTLRSRIPLLGLAAVLLLAVVASTASAGFTGQTRNSGWSWTVAQWTQPYVQAVLADSPQVFWLLDEKVGTATAQDRSGNQVLGSFKSAAVLGQAGGLPDNPGTSMSTSGGLALAAANASAPASSHTTELWFRSGSQAGGQLSGFAASATTGVPSYEDRVVRLTASGRITYGDWATNQYSVITTPGAYADSTWHHVVVASTPANGGRETTVIYVDGVARASGPTSRVEAYYGYVRVGGGSGTSAFNGTIDNVSVYSTALSAQRVAAHYAAR
jgi:signal peptidase I